MYGTVARMQIKSGMRDEAYAEFQRQAEINIPGNIITYAYMSDNNPDEVWLATVFESKEAYRKNAESPEQNDRFMALMKYLASEPEWHDGAVRSSQDGMVTA